jgi:mannose-6-phosphate isomerase-like protein (cupin superfamily)
MSKTNPTHMEVINLESKFNLFSDHWSPKIIGELNGQEVKLAKVKGEFVWHNHEHEDELFFVVKGKLKIEFRGRTVELLPGEMIIVPKKEDHRPYADEEVWLMLFEPVNTKHTGDVEHPLTVKKYERL